jgi:hypothetical protein
LDDLHSQSAILLAELASHGSLLLFNFIFLIIIIIIIIIIIVNIIIVNIIIIIIIIMRRRFSFINSKVDGTRQKITEKEEVVTNIAQLIKTSLTAQTKLHAIWALINLALDRMLFLSKASYHITCFISFLYENKKKL